MTTIRSGWPTFRQWQLAHAAATDPARLRRVISRQLDQAVAPAVRRLTDALSALGSSAAATALQPLLDAMRGDHDAA